MLQFWGVLQTTPGGTPVDTPHQGSLARYQAGCRCQACRRAYRVNAAHHQDIARLLRAHPELATRIVPPAQHGLRSTYVRWGCRCDPCKAANTNYQRQRRGRPTTAERGLST